MATKQQVHELASSHPDLSPAQMAERIGTTPEYIRATLSRKRAADNREKGIPVLGRVSTWTDEDLKQLVHLRNSGMRWAKVAEEMNRPLGSCYDRYAKICSIGYPNDPIIVPELPRVNNIPFHQQLGIETYVHMQPMTHDRQGRAFMPVTLAKV
jgi:hypothetical protein